MKIERQILSTVKKRNAMYSGKNIIALLPPTVNYRGKIEGKVVFEKREYLDKITLSNRRVLLLKYIKILKGLEK